MIDTSEALNIKDFVINDPKTAEKPFDPGTDISDQAWKDIAAGFFVDKIASIQSPERAPDVLKTATEMKILAGKNSSRYPILSQNNWDTFEESLIYAKNMKNWKEYLGILSDIHLLNPARAMDPRYKVDSEAMDPANYSLDHLPLEEVLHNAASIKMIAPDTNLKIADVSLSELQQRIRRFKEAAPMDKENFLNERIDILGMINNLKIIDPAKAKQISYSFNSSIEDMRKEMETLLEPTTVDWVHGRNMLIYRRYAYQLHLYSAEKIAMTDDGLKLEMPGPKTDLSQQETVPEVRNF